MGSRYRCPSVGDYMLMQMPALLLSEAVSRPEARMCPASRSQNSEWVSSAQIISTPALFAPLPRYSRH